MVWTFLVFGISLYILIKAVFPRIRDALDERRHAIDESIDAAERTRIEADKILAEYRERLKEARAQSDEIVQRARQTAESHEHESRDRAQEILAEAAKRAERDIEAASKRALDDIRREVADLTIMATEKVTRKTLNDADQRRLVEEALGELDFSVNLIGGREQLMEALAQVYARSLFQAALEKGRLDELREQLAQFADALDQRRELAVFFFSPYFSSTEKQQALASLLDGADELLINFLKLLIENHRMPVIFRIRHEYERLWDEENKTLPVEITSAIALDEATTESLGRTIGERAGRKVTLAARVDPNILGGIIIRVGNSILDASIRNRLEQLRRHVAQGAS